MVLEQLYQLAVTTPVEHLAHEHAIRSQMRLRKVDGQLDQVGNAGGIRHLDARQVGGHVRHDHIDGPPAQHVHQLLQHRVFTEIALDEMHPLDRLEFEQVQRDDGPVEFACRRTAGARLFGRKPSPQFLFDARDEFGLDLARSFMIGDKLIDLECGWNAGVQRSLLVRTGYGRKVEQKGGLKDAMVVDDLPAAAQWILAQPS